MFSFLEILFPGKARLKKEIAEAHQELSPLTENLVSWEGEELELMSLIQVERKVRSAFSSSVQGIICSIYHEHMIAYLWKKLAAVGDLAIIVAATKKYRYEYIQKGDNCSMYVNDHYLGDLKRDNKLYLSKRSILASINVTGAEWWQIDIEGQYAGSLVNIDKARHVNPRAFQLRRDLSEEKVMVFLALAIFKIIDSTRKMKKIPFE